MLTVGLTGGVASGKTTAALILEKLGAVRVDCDQIAHGLLNKGKPECARVLKHFGPGIRTSAGGVNRAKLRQAVLACPSELRFLERTLHPGVRREVARIAERLKSQRGIVVVEVPLLFETGMDRAMDRTVCVTAPAPTRMRNAARKGMRLADWKRFTARQWPQARKARKADRVVRNSGTVIDFYKEVKALFNKLSKEEESLGQQR